MREMFSLKGSLTFSLFNADVDGSTSRYSRNYGSRVYCLTGWAEPMVSLPL